MPWNICVRMNILSTTHYLLTHFYRWYFACACKCKWFVHIISCTYLYRIYVRTENYCEMWKWNEALYLSIARSICSHRLMWFAFPVCCAPTNTDLVRIIIYRIWQLKHPICTVWLVYHFQYTTVCHQPKYFTRNSIHRCTFSLQSESFCTIPCLKQSDFSRSTYICIFVSFRPHFYTSSTMLNLNHIPIMIKLIWLSSNGKCLCVSVNCK